MIRHVLVFGLLILASAPARADDAREKLKAVENTLTQRKAEAAALAQKAAAENASLSGLRQNLIAATEELQQKQDEQKQLQDKQDDLADDIAAKRRALAGERRKLGALVTALLELNRQPPESLLLQSGLTEDYIHRAIYVRALLPRLRAQAESLNRDLGVLREMKSRMNEQERLTAAATDNLNQQRQKLDQLLLARQGLAQQTEAQKAEIQAQLVSLTNEAKDLHQLLDKVSPKKPPHAESRMGAAPSLRWPVAGPATRHFGDRDADGVRSEGIDFAALSGAPVVAPAGGKVVFAGPFKGYGPIVILQHKGGYHSLMAGFGRIDVEVGEEIEAGEPLGVMPVKSGARPELYFEWRRNGEPVDPAGRNP